MTRSAWVLLALIVARLVSFLGFAAATLAAVAVWPSPWALALGMGAVLLLAATGWVWWRVRRSLRELRAQYVSRIRCGKTRGDGARARRRSADVRSGW